MLQNQLGRALARPCRVVTGSCVRKSSSDVVSEDTDKKYTTTVSLPHTAYPLRPVDGVLAMEAGLRDSISADQYTWQEDASRLRSNKGAAVEPGTQYVLHDGPPFANGSLHLGHFLNKTLKDVFNRYKMLRGYDQRFYPGWDCHGLPIELKACTVDNPVDDSAILSPSKVKAIEIRTTAHNFALQAAEGQKKEMLEWGLLGDYDKAYLTLHREYEARQLQVLATMFSKGMLYRGLMPVHWSPTSQTALAEAELEYEDHVSKALYVSFPLVNIGTNTFLEPYLQPVVAKHMVERAEQALFTSKILNQGSHKGNTYLTESTIGSGVGLLIWTTTPWTLLANRAIAYNADLAYIAVQVSIHTVLHASSVKGKDMDARRVQGTLHEKRVVIITQDRLADLETIFKQGNSADLDRIAMHKDTVWTDIDVDPSIKKASVTEQVRNVSFEVLGNVDLTGLSYTHPLTNVAREYLLQDSKQVALVENNQIVVKDKASTEGMDINTLYPCFKLIAGSHVTAEAGTGLVHTAPGHGVDDFKVGQANDVPVACPVDGKGDYVSDVGVLAGLNVLHTGNQASILCMAQTGSVQYSENYTHRYPFDWRTKKPVIFRATEQWFCSLEEVRETALQALQNVKVIPNTGRLDSFIKGRAQWCISRQRKWGLPIPVLYHRDTNAVLATESSMLHVSSVFQQYGSMAWWLVPHWMLVETEYRGAVREKYVQMSDTDMRAIAAAHSAELTAKIQKVDLSVTVSLEHPYDYYDCEYVPGEETMDVWLDSGSSWFSVLAARGHVHDLVKKSVPADLLLEGSDQHRGWFQSSTLVSAAVTGMASTKTILSHGFVIDTQGKKMSKSQGNGVEPADLIKGFTGKSPLPPALSKGIGADNARLWACTVDSTTDAVFSASIVSAAIDMQRRWRGLARFFLGALVTKQPHAEDWVEFQPNDVLPISELRPVDQWILHQLAVTSAQITEAMDQYAVHRAVNTLNVFMNGPLSSLYTDYVKDTLYCDAVDSYNRKCVQTTILYLLEALVKTMAPFAPHLVQDLYNHCSPAVKSFFTFGKEGIDATAPESLFGAGWVDHSEFLNEQAHNQLQFVWSLRTALHKTMERGKKAFKEGTTTLSVNKTSQVQMVLQITCTSSEKTNIDLALQKLNIMDLFGVSGIDILTRVATEDQLPTEETFEIVNVEQHTIFTLNMLAHSLDKNVPIGVKVALTTAPGHRCPRCWNVSSTEEQFLQVNRQLLQIVEDPVAAVIAGATPGQHIQHCDNVDHLCKRCDNVV